MAMHVSVKWGKQVFADVEVDMELSPLVFKTQLFTLSGVPPERQKVMIKAKMLKDESWDSVGKLKDGQTVLLMGTAETDTIVAKPTDPLPTFVLPEEEQEFDGFSEYGAGLRNLGNTCYMNATMQLLYAVSELREGLVNYDGSGGTGLSGQLTAAAGALFKDMTHSSAPVIPIRFLSILRSKYPQFAEATREGYYRQQDAEECFSQLTHTLTETMKTNPPEGPNTSLVHDLFGIDLVTTLTSKETEESITVRSTSTSLKCNIPQIPPIHHVHEGIVEGLKADRTQRSETAGADVLFEGKSEIEKLSSYVVVHMVRFAFRVDTSHRAKILRKVVFPATLDLYEFCTEAYKAKLDCPRTRAEALRDQEIENKRKANEGETSMTSATDTGETPATQMEMDVVPQEPAQPPMSKAITGRYRLQGVLTHKGRNADSGHYIAWVKQEDNSWIQFDDDTLSPRTEADVLQLCGGGDWHMSYLLLFKAETVEMPQSE